MTQLESEGRLRSGAGSNKPYQGKQLQNYTGFLRDKTIDDKLIIMIFVCLYYERSFKPLNRCHWFLTHSVATNGFRRGFKLF